MIKSSCSRDERLGTGTAFHEANSFIKDESVAITNGGRVFPGGSDYKESARNAGHLGLIPGSERSPGEGNSNPLRYSCLQNPMDREEPGGLYPIGSQRVGHD